MQDETLLCHGELAKPEDFQDPHLPNHSEIAGASAYTPAIWVEKDPKTGFVTFPKRNQEQQSTCTTYALAKALAIDEKAEHGVWRELSPRSLYAYFFQPGGGTNSLVVAQASCKQGMTLEYLLPTDGLTEAQAEQTADYAPDAKIIGTVYAPQQINICAPDFETIASTLQAYQKQGINKGILLTVIGSNNGTWYSLMPQPPANQNVWYHKIVVTDFGLIDGKKYLAFDNTFGPAAGNAGQQFLGENYSPFMYGSFYTMNKEDDWMTSSAASAVVKPTHTWSVPLSPGSAGPDVLALQQALQSIGMFPVSSVVAPTGTYAGITKAGVIEFQGSFGLPQTGLVDTATIAELNKIFGASA